MSEDYKEKFITALTQLTFAHPFFATISMYLNPIYSKFVPTAGVNVVTLDLLINPELIRKHSLQELQFILAHEVMHVVLADERRRLGRNPELWNVAMDYEINCILTEAGIGERPNWVLYDNSFCGKSAEEIYEILKRETPVIKVIQPTKIPRAPKGGLPGGAVYETPTGMTDVHVDIEDLEKEYGKSKVDDAIRRNTGITVRAEQMARAAGLLPLGIQRIIESMFAPKIPWQTLLKKYVKSFAGRGDYRWVPPSRRYPSIGIYLPGTRSEYIELAVAIDSSGSVSDKEMSEFVAIVEDLMKELRDFTIHLIICDAKVHSYQKLTRGSSIDKSKIKGYGGTNFMPAFNFVKDRGIRPDLFIYLTDGFPNKWPEELPSYPVIWVINNNRAKVPWGHVIRLTEFR